MNWPMPQDFNESVQNPGSAFSDPELKSGQPVVGPAGLPLPRSGNFADVYQIRLPDGRDWAVKCFTRPVTGLEDRYAKVEEALDRAGLPFTIGFTFLSEGIWVRGQWRPALKMEWVDGLLLNQVVRDQAGSPKVLDALCQMWARLCKRLRESGIVHADLQHGNVLLVPGSRPGAYGLKLIDYDGMYIPSLANTPSGEVGHPNYQHPSRAAKQVYSPDLDRFPHLVIATAIKGLSVLGPSLWERYDTGDNLLFTENDFQNPAASKVMQEMWQTGHPGLQALVGTLAVACGRPIPQTPWLDQLAPDGVAVPLSAEASRAAVAALGLASPAPVSVSPAFQAVPIVDAVEVEMVAPPPSPPAPAELEFIGDEPEDTPRRKKSSTKLKKSAPKKVASPLMPIALVAGGLLLLGGGGVAAFLAMGGKKPEETAQTPPGDPGDQPKPAPTPAPPKDKPKPPPYDGPKPPDTPIVPPPNNGAMSTSPVPLNSLPRLPVRWEKPIGNGRTVSRMAFTGDGKWLAASTYGSGAIAVVDPKTGTQDGTFTGHEGSVVGIAPNPGGKFVSLAADQPFAITWDASTTKGVGRIPLPPVPTRVQETFAYASPNGRYLVCGGTESGNWQPAPVPPPPVTVTDVDTGKPVVSFQFSWGAARFTTDSTRLVVADDKTGRLRVYQLASGQLERETTAAGVAPQGLVIAISPDGRHVVYRGPSVSRQLYVHEVATGRRVHTIPVSRLAGFRSGFSPDGKWLAVVCRSPSPPGTEVVLVDTATWAPVAVAETGNTGSVQWDHGPRFSPDGTLFVVPKVGGNVVAFELPREGLVLGQTPPPVAPPQPPPTALSGGGPPVLKPQWVTKVTGEPILGAFAFDKTGETLLVGSQKSPGGLSAFNAETGRQRFATGNPVLSDITRFTPVGEGKYAAYSAGSRLFFLADAKAPGGNETIRPPASADVTNAYLSLSPDKKYISVAKDAVTSGNQTNLSPFQIFDLSTGAEIAKGEWSGGSILFTGDSSRVLVAARNRSFRWFKLPSGMPDGQYDVDGQLAPDARVLSMSSDGRVVLVQGTTPGGTRAFHLFDGATGKLIRTLAQGTRYLADDKVDLGSDDGKVFILRAHRPEGMAVEAFDGATGSIIARMPVTDDPKAVIRPTLSHDGRRVAVYLPERGEVMGFDLPGGAIAAVPKSNSAPAAGSRIPVPDDAAVAKAEATIREVLKADYARKLQSDKKALAKKLLGLAEQTKDKPTDRYVLLRDARDLAAEGLDPAMAVQAVEEMAKLYEVDEQRLKLEILEKTVNGTASSAVLRAVAETALTGSDQAAASDDYERAIKYAQLAGRAARKGALTGGVAEEADFRISQAKKGTEGLAAVKDALEKLKATPDDPEANLAVGKYRCFVQARWDEGLKHLVKGNNAVLKAAAELDAKASQDSSVETQAGEAWWEFAQKEAKDAEKRAAENRARLWYARAYPRLTGLDKAQAENRIAFKDNNGVEYRLGLVAEFAAKNATIVKGERGRIDSGVNFNMAEFGEVKGTVRTSEFTVKWSGAILAPRPGRYKLVIETNNQPIPPSSADSARVRLNGKLLMEVSPANKLAKTEALVTLTDRPMPVVVEYHTTRHNNTHWVKLRWVAPGDEKEEPLPPEVLFHDKKLGAKFAK